MGAYETLKAVYEKEREEKVYTMHRWSIINNLEDEFIEEIMHSPHLDKWDNEALVKRFGYFVIEHFE